MVILLIDIEIQYQIFHLSLNQCYGELYIKIFNESEDTSLKCRIETIVMAYKEERKLINTKDVVLLPRKVADWKIQENDFFIFHCLSKRDKKNNSVIRFKVDILVVISQESISKVKQSSEDQKSKEKEARLNCSCQCQSKMNE